MCAPAAPTSMHPISMPHVDGITVPLGSFVLLRKAMVHLHSFGSLVIATTNTMSASSLAVA
jgi:hypothetical protein